MKDEGSPVEEKAALAMFLRRITNDAYLMTKLDCETSKYSLQKCNERIGRAAVTIETYN